ncbi:MAG: chromosome segregation protein SMC [Eubacteriaceae bacterium]
MYLKKINISGFKSFADPVSLEFSKGISAIVGPNGSGKSNITDAIKWVLGEQSIKSLRGKKMEDVIFSGTEKKLPSNYAEVLLFLDNSEGTLEGYPQEVVIARRLFRSGESDYAINNRRCKLKDVQSVFMDTGLGKNGYSLISQGGIENIISSTPTELRGIFEEAVGIVSYKTKKNEAEKKLEVTQGNLDRLRDIFLEIEKQCGPLKNQSKRAKTYLSLKEELKIVDLVNFYENMENSLGMMDVYQKNYESIRKSCENNEKKIEENDEAYQKLMIRNRELEKLLGSGKESLSEIKSRLQKNQGEEIRSNSQIEANRISAKRLEADHDAIKKEIKINEDRLQELNKATATLENELMKKTKERNNIEVERNKILDKIALEKKKEDEYHLCFLSNQAQKEKYEEELLEIKSNIQGIKAEINFISQRMIDINKEKEKQTQGLSVLENELKILEAVEIEKEKLKKALVLDISKKMTFLEEIKRKIRELKNSCQVNQSKAEFLKNVQKNYQDYFPAIRKLMTSEKILGNTSQNIYGPVGELITTASKYIQAIDIALGGKSQNIVVENVKTARVCIDLLKSQRLGRATFLPLDNLRVSLIEKKIQTGLIEISGFEGIGSNLVKTEPKFEKAIESLLGRIIIASDFTSGKEIQSFLKSRFTVVTLEGEIFYPGGAIVGGENKEGKQSPLFKKIEIEKLLRQVANFKKELDELEAQQSEIESLLEDAQKKDKNLDEKLNNIKKEIWEKSKDKQSILKKINEMALTEEKIAYQKEQLENNRNFLIISNKQKMAEYEGLKELLEPITHRKEMDSIREKLDNLVEEISKHQMRITEVEGEIKGKELQRKLLMDQLDLQIQRKESQEKQIKSYENEISRIENQLEDIQKEIKTLMKTLNEGQTKNKASYDEQKENLKKLEILRDEIKNANHDLIVNNDEKNKVETQINNLQMKIEIWQESIFENYEMNMLMVQDYYDELIKKESFKTLDFSEEHQRELKTKIANLGNVNLEAIEDYENILERHAFLKKQIEDLEHGKRELLDIINSLYDAMTEQFREKFKVLQEKFTRIFGILFEGGRAYLEFTDPTGVLEGGVELVAQPPGKRLRHISLLSGGEKSMVAISLLFSFLEINPSPFCVIDEIDAALDDHNIFRYISYLKKISESNQFITITHRRKTLEVCDNLYGISMSRQGVSQLVSVKLSEYH